MVVSNGDDFLFVFGCFAGTNILGNPHELGLKIDFLSKIGLCSRSTSVTGMVYVRFSSEIGNHRP